MSARVTGVRRVVLLAALLYLALDVTHPSIPGALSFDPEACTEAVRAERGRTQVVAPTVALLPLAVAPAARESADRPARHEAPAAAPGPRHRPHKRPARSDPASPTDDH
jgi:hypothetical protein